MKKWTQAALTAAILLGSMPPLQTQAASAIKVIVNDQELRFNEVQPQLISEKTMVPLRELFEALQASVTWDGNSQTVFIEKGARKIVLQINNPIATLNGKEIKLEAPALLVDNHTMVPLRFVGEALGHTVSWYDNTATIHKKSQSDAQIVINGKPIAELVTFVTKGDQLWVPFETIARALNCVIEKPDELEVAAKNGTSSIRLWVGVDHMLYVNNKKIVPGFAPGIMPGGTEVIVPLSFIDQAFYAKTQYDKENNQVIIETATDQQLDKKLALLRAYKTVNEYDGIASVTVKADTENIKQGKSVYTNGQHREFVLDGKDMYGKNVGETDYSIKRVNGEEYYIDASGNWELADTFMEQFEVVDMSLLQIYLSFHRVFYHALIPQSITTQTVGNEKFNVYKVEYDQATMPKFEFYEFLGLPYLSELPQTILRELGMEIWMDSEGRIAREVFHYKGDSTQDIVAPVTTTTSYAIEYTYNSQ